MHFVLLLLGIVLLRAAEEAQAHVPSEREIEQVTALLRAQMDASPTTDAEDLALLREIALRLAPQMNERQRAAMALVLRRLEARH